MDPDKNERRRRLLRTGCKPTNDRLRPRESGAEATALQTLRVRGPVPELGRRLIHSLLFAAISFPAFGQNEPVKDPDLTSSNGLYYVSATGTGQTLHAPDGTAIEIGERAEIKILKAYVFANNNANTDFQVWLNTDDYPVHPKTGAMPKTVVLRIGGHAYWYGGGGGKTGNYNEMQFAIHGREEAELAANGLSGNFVLRKPPGYRFFSQFVPTKTEFQTNEPVLVRFSIENLDDRIIAFQNGGQQRGYRDNQYGFRAMFNWDQPVADIGSPENFGGLCQLVNLQPGKTFESEIDLKKWFAFDKAGTYAIHGFFALEFHTPDHTVDSLSSRSLLWSDYASADFTVIVK